MEHAAALDGAGQKVRFSLPWGVWNLLGEQAVFMLTRKG